MTERKRLEAEETARRADEEERYANSQLTHTPTYLNIHIHFRHDAHVVAAEKLVRLRQLNGAKKAVKVTCTDTHTHTLIKLCIYTVYVNVNFTQGGGDAQCRCARAKTCCGAPSPRGSCR